MAVRPRPIVLALVLLLTGLGVVAPSHVEGAGGIISDGSPPDLALLYTGDVKFIETDFMFGADTDIPLYQFSKLGLAGIIVGIQAVTGS